jgi:hypothetical protein
MMALADAVIFVVGTGILLLIASLVFDDHSAGARAYDRAYKRARRAGAFHADANLAASQARTAANLASKRYQRKQQRERDRKVRERQRGEAFHRKNTARPPARELRSEEALKRNRERFHAYRDDVKDAEE